jgi:PD-(D/E)XK nuclease superfamily
MDSGLPNIFDQYSVDENRVTNALLQTLAASPSLTRSFLRHFLNLRLRSRRPAIVISAQKRPKALGDRTDTARAESDKNSVPDGWIYCEDEDWVVVLESKIYRNSVRPEQLAGHLRGVRSSNSTYLLVLTPDKKKPKPLLLSKFKKARVVWHPWEKIHRWVARSKDIKSSQSAAGLLTRRLKEYLEMYEDLSEFQGIDFSEGFEPQRAKLLLKSLMDKIRGDVLGIYDLPISRPRIPVGVSGVWDCFGAKGGFTSDLHFSLGINLQNGTGISLTVPNGAKQRWRRLGEICENPALRNEFADVLWTVSSPVPEFWIGLNQRHFMGRTREVSDARLDFKVETFRRRQKSGTKFFPLWFETLLSALQSRRRGNFQLGFSARFPFKYEKMKTPEFADIALKTIKAFMPLYLMIKKEK